MMTRPVNSKSGIRKALIGAGVVGLAGSALGQSVDLTSFDYFHTGKWTQGSGAGGFQEMFGPKGAVGIEWDRTRPGHKALFLRPHVTRTTLVQTQSALVIRTGNLSKFDIIAWEQTLRQYPVGATPGARDVGWLLWDYSDNAHFYAFILERNGWELIKQDPSYPGGQIVLDAGIAPTAPINAPQVVEISQSGATVVVQVDGASVVDYTDQRNTYLSGSLGFYAQNAYVHFFGAPVPFAAPGPMPPGRPQPQLQAPSGGKK